MSKYCLNYTSETIYKNSIRTTKYFAQPENIFIGWVSVNYRKKDSSRIAVYNKNCEKIEESFEDCLDARQHLISEYEFEHGIERK